MHHVYNGMAATELRGVAWQKSRHSNSQGSCVEFASCPAETWRCATRATPTGPALVYTRAEIEAMLLGVKDGEFDHLVAAADRRRTGGVRARRLGRVRTGAPTRVDPGVVDAAVRQPEQRPTPCRSRNSAQTTLPPSVPGQRVPAPAVAERVDQEQAAARLRGEVRPRSRGDRALLAGVAHRAHQP